MVEHDAEEIDAKRRAEPEDPEVTIEHDYDTGPFYSYLPDIIRRLSDLLWPIGLTISLCVGLVQYKACEVETSHDKSEVQSAYARSTTEISKAKLEAQKARDEAFKACAGKPEDYGCIEFNKCWNTFYGVAEK